jgi:hypothetical protein
MTRQYGHYWLIIDYDYFAMITAIAIFATSHAITPPLRHAFSMASHWLADHTPLLYCLSAIFAIIDTPLRRHYWLAGF